MMRGYFNGFDQYSQFGSGFDRYSQFGSHMGSGYMWIGMTFRVLVIVALSILVIWAVKTIVHSKNSKEISVNKSLEIIKERYAKGEINKEEYDILYKNLV